MNLLSLILVFLALVIVGAIGFIAWELTSERVMSRADKREPGASKGNMNQAAGEREPGASKGNTNQAVVKREPDESIGETETPGSKEQT